MIKNEFKNGYEIFDANNVEKLDILRKQLDKLELIKVYEQEVGLLFANHTKEVNFIEGVLYIHLDSASLKQELSYVKEGLIQKLNQKMGKTLVEKIVIK